MLTLAAETRGWKREGCCHPRSWQPFGGLGAWVLLISVLLSCQEEAQGVFGPSLDPMALEWADIPGGVYCTQKIDYKREYIHMLNGVNDFEMMAFEVTQDQYVRWHGSLPNGNDDCPQCPVLGVAASDAAAFCEAVGGRLPTEDEWMYASYGGGWNSPVCMYDEECLLRMAWCPQNSCSTPHPVGLKLPNPYGLYDMVGNAAEWVFSCNWYQEPTEDEVINKTVYHDCHQQEPAIVIEFSFMNCEEPTDFAWWFFGGVSYAEKYSGFRCAR